MATCSAACFRFIEVSGIAVNIEDHVAGRVGDDSIFLGGNVVEKFEYQS